MKHFLIFNSIFMMLASPPPNSEEGGLPLPHICAEYYQEGGGVNTDPGGNNGAENGNNSQNSFKVLDYRSAKRVHARMDALVNRRVDPVQLR